MTYPKKYRVEVVSDNPKQGLLSCETIPKTTLKDYLNKVAPNCNVDVERIFTDKRCRYFRHYMPANQTIAKNAYKANNVLFDDGNRVKLYISEIPF